AERVGDRPAVRWMQQAAAVLDAAVGAGRRQLHLDLEREVAHHGARAGVMKMMLARCLRRVGVEQAVGDRPDIHFPVPVGERLLIEEYNNNTTNKKKHTTHTT